MPQRRSTAWKCAPRPRQYSSRRGNTFACSAFRSAAKSVNVELKKTRKIRLRGLMTVLVGASRSETATLVLVHRSAIGVCDRIVRHGVAAKGDDAEEELGLIDPRGRG